MTYSNSLLIDGTNVTAFPGVFAVGVIDGLFAPGDRRGDDSEIPGRHGSIGARLPFAKYLISVPLWLRGDTVHELNRAMLDIGEMFRAAPAGSGLVQLSRHLDGAGSTTLVHYAQGRYASGLNFQTVNHTAARTDLQVYNLSGSWWNGSDWIVP